MIIYAFIKDKIWFNILKDKHVIWKISFFNCIIAFFL